ncbi:MAG: MgtC/SapB family protein [Sphingobium sp.]
MNVPLTLLLSLGLGLLIGLERGWRQRGEHQGGRIAGIRTFGLLGLGGGLCGLLATTLSIWFAVVGLAAMSGAILLAHHARLDESDDNVSATNAIVGILTAMLGLLATTGHEREALVSGGAITLLLSMRAQLHEWLRMLSEKDIRAVAQYGAIALVVLPLLPDRAMGPYGALNPRLLWLVVVFVTGLSFAGYWASKRFGHARGVILAAAIGATYSSTAVTLDLARRFRQPDQDFATLNAGIAAATAMMPARTIILCAVVAYPALGRFALNVGPAFVCAALYAAFMTARASRQEDGETMTLRGKPFDFWPAVGFAALVAAIVIGSHWMIEHFGDRGATFMIGLTGLYDVDAAIIAAASLPRVDMGWNDIAFLLALPVLANTLVKLALVLGIAGWKQGLVAGIPLVLTGALIGGVMALGT